MIKREKKTHTHNKNRMPAIFLCLTHAQTASVACVFFFCSSVSIGAIHRSNTRSESPAALSFSDVFATFPLHFRRGVKINQQLHGYRFQYHQQTEPQESATASRDCLYREWSPHRSERSLIIIIVGFPFFAFVLILLFVGICFCPRYV